MKKLNLTTYLTLSIGLILAQSNSHFEKWNYDSKWCFPKVDTKEISKLNLSPSGLLSFKILGEDQELPHLDVVSLLEDSRGDIWIGLAHGGILKYSPTQLSFYKNIPPFQGTTVMDIEEDLQGNIWFATFGNGLIKYDGHCFYNYNTNSGFPEDYVMCLHFTIGGKMMAGLSNKGIVDLYIDGYSLSSLNDLLPHKKVWSILEDKKGIIWVGLIKTGLCKIDGKAVQIWNSSTHKNFPNGTIRCLFEDSNDRIWVSADDGIAYFSESPEGHDLNSFPNSPKQIYDILEISGEIWFGSNINGVFIWNGKDFKHLGLEHGLIHERIKCLIHDKDSNIWLGSLGGGIMRLDDWIFQNYYNENGVQGSVNAIAQLNDGRIIIAPEGGGLRVKEGLNFVPFKGPYPLNDYNIWGIHTRKNGEIWLVTDGLGLVKITNGKLETWDSSVKYGNRFICIEEDKFGNIYAGGFNGITCIHKNGYVEKITNSELEGVEIWDLHYDDQNLWVGTNGEGLWTLIDSQDGKTLVKVPTDPALEKSVVPYITSGNNGEIWIALESKGLAKLIKSAHQNYYLTAIHHPDLSNSTIYSVQSDNSGIWLGSSTGLTQVSLHGESIQVKNFDRFEGIRTIQATAGKVLKDSMNHIWWGTEKYLLEYVPENKKKQKSMPTIRIMDIGIFNERRTNWAELFADSSTNKSSSYWKSLWEEYILIEQIESWSHLPQGLSISHEQNNISFNYTINSWNPSKSISYQHRLMNFDDDWIDQGSATTSVFKNLPPGSYTYEVRVRDRNEQWSEPANFSFTITPPFWKTPWFIALAALAIAFLFYALLKWRLRRINQEKELLEEQVELRTSQLVEEKDKSERLLLNFLPAETVEELKELGTASTKNYDQASVLFSDFKGFTRLSESITPQELIETLDIYFQAFDEVATEYGVEKIKTIGDAYMCACGIPIENKHHAPLLLAFGLHLLHLAQGINRNRIEHGEKAWEIRVGIHSGPLIAGVVGKTKIAYDIWGDTVNIASRMESSGEENKINVSAACKALCEEYFEFSARGAVAAKNKGLLEMYFVEGFKSEYAMEGNVMLANEVFFRKLRGA